MSLSGVVRLFAALNANQRPGEIGAAVATGFLAGLLPGVSLLWVGVVSAALLSKVYLPAFFLFLGLFALAAPLLDPLLDLLGGALLLQPGLAPLFSAVVNVPLAPFLNLNETLVMGALVVGLVLWVPIFLGVRALVRLYRERLRSRLVESRLFKAFMASPPVVLVTRALTRVGRIFARMNS